MRQGYSWKMHTARQFVQILTYFFAFSEGE